MKNFSMLLVLLVFTNPLSAKGYKWKIQECEVVADNYDNQKNVAYFPVLFANHWIHSVCSTCTKFTLYSHPQVSNRWLVTNREKSQAYGIWFKIKHNHFELVDCYLLNESGTNDRNDEENLVYGEAHGILADYADIGFSIEESPELKNELFSYPLKHTYKTITEHEFNGWQWTMTMFPDYPSMLRALDEFSNEKDIKNIQVNDKTVYYQKKHYTDITKTVQDDE